MHFVRKAHFASFPMQHGMRALRGPPAEARDTHQGNGEGAGSSPIGQQLDVHSDERVGGCPCGDAELSSSQAVKLSNNLPLGEQIAELSKCSANRALISLDVSHSHLEDLTFLSSMVQLKELDLTGCRRLTDMSTLACCTGLRKLVMWQPPTYVNASGADKEAQLEMIKRWESYPRMKVVSSALCHLASLQELYLGVSPDQVGTCGWVTSVAFAPKMLQLRLLSLRGCSKLVDVSPLAACPALLVADLRDVGYRYACQMSPVRSAITLESDLLTLGAVG